MPATLKKLLVVILLVVSIGTPWAMLQWVAWLGMVASYSRQTTFLRAVVITFDGKHPCRLCHYVQQGQATERQKKKDTLEPEKKLQLGLSPEISLFLQPPPPARWVRINFPCAFRAERPPTPPPRPA